MRQCLVALVAILALTSCSLDEREAKQLVLGALKDPESAKWRNVNAVASNLVCGQVNAKNAMGGYAGFTNFMVRDGALYLAEGEDGSSEISLCCAVIQAHMTTPNDPKYTKARVHESCDSIPPDVTY